MTPLDAAKQRPLELLDLPAEPRASPEPKETTSALIDRMVDWRLLHPASKWADFATQLGLRAGTLYRLAQTDLYKARYAAAREKIRGAIEVSVMDQTEGLFQQALDRVSADLESTQTSAETALKAFDLAAKMLGMHGNGSVGPAHRGPQQLQVIVQSTLVDARAAIRERRDGGDQRSVSSRDSGRDTGRDPNDRSMVPISSAA